MKKYHNTKNVPKYMFGKGAIHQLNEILLEVRTSPSDPVVYFVDHFFTNRSLEKFLPFGKNDQVIFIDTTDEPKTELIDKLNTQQRQKERLPACVIGIGGGSILDIAKAVSNMLTNEGRAEDYQGWELVKNPGVYKIGIPTLSGTGSESSRTCVLTNVKKGLKLGMNSDFTMFNQLILDPELLRTVSRDQYFYTGIDTYFHCMESLKGSYRNMIVDALSEKSVALCREVFLSEDMMSDENLEKIMIASYLGGCAAGNVGIVHPVSAGLSIALGVHHGLANCLAMNGLEEFYSEEYAEYKEMISKQKVNIPENVCSDLSEDIYEKLYSSSIIHEKPLINALGNDFRKILTRQKMLDIFKRI